MGMLNRLHPLSWSLWWKFLAGFVLAMVVPVILAYYALQPSLREAGLQNLRAYVAENGDRQRNQVNNTLTRVRQDLRLFIDNPTYNRLLTALLLRNSPALASEQLGASSVLEVQSLLDRRLLDPAQNFFLSAYLLDINGRLAAFAVLDQSALDIRQQDQSQSPAFQAMRNEQLKAQPQSQVLVLREEANNPVIELASALYWRDGTPIGYLIVELNNSAVFYANLTFENPAYPAYSFLVTTDGVPIISPDVKAGLFVVDASTLAVERALLGEVGSAVYTLSDVESEVVGYYAPIADAPLVLISEVPTAHALDQAAGYFDARFFVVGAGSVAFILALAAVFNQIIVPPLARLRRAAQGIAQGSFDEPIKDTGRRDEIGALAVAFVNMRDQIESLINDLEARIAARTRDINATQDISRYAVSERDLSRLMTEVVNLIVDRFPSIYHAQIFLIDSNREYAVLRASTGEAGQQLLARNHRLGVGSISVIGQVTAQGEIVHARDTTSSSVHRRNEFLPETRAELAIPLRVGAQVIGALDVQSKQNDAFNDDLINVLQTTADQIAIAIENARLYEESVARLRELERRNRAATLLAWQEYMRDRRISEITRQAGKADTVSGESELRQRAYETQRIAIGAPTARQTLPLAVPIILRGQVLGVVEWELPSESISDGKLQLAQELANRLALSLDNARLFQNSQSLVERERIVSGIAAQLTTQTDIEEILQTAVREVGQALRAPQVSIRLHGSQNGGNGYESE